MTKSEIRLVLERAPNDPAVSDANYQKQLAQFCEALRDAGVEVIPDVVFKELASGELGVQTVYAGAFAINLAKVVATPMVVAAVAGVCGAWIQARYGRKVRLKIGDVEAEGRTVAEVKSLLEKAKQFQQEKLSKIDES